MNYLKQIIAFDKWEELHPLSDKTYKLWFKLMAIANASEWDEWLSVPLLKLKSELHTNRDQTILDCRNALVQAGRIEVRKGKHGKSAEYRLIPFPEPASGGAKGDSTGVNTGDSTGDNTGDSTGDNRGAYIKQNKTKQNKTKYSSHGSQIHDEKQLAKQKNRKRYASDSREYLLAAQLRDGIMHNNPDHRKITEAQLQKWADVMRLMMDRDNRTFDQIGNMIDWCQQDDFWQTNILSAASLRKQYDRMKVKASKEWRRGRQAQRVQDELNSYAKQYPM